MKGAFISRLGFWWLLAMASGIGFSAESGNGKKDGVAQTKPDAKAATDKDGKPAAKPADPSDGLSSFCRLLPLGQKNLDVKIPSFTDGRLTSLIKSHTMTRVDDDHMEMEKMDVVLKGQTEATDMNVKMRTAVYHMPTSVLSSDDRSRVSRNDFQIEGDSLVFDTRTQQGKMAGHVEMIIYDSAKLQGEPKTAPRPDGKINDTTAKPIPRAEAVIDEKKETK